jgi:hypothetical protein
VNHSHVVHPDGLATKTQWFILVRVAEA